MLPSVWPGDLLIVTRAKPAALRPGDIVLFTRDSRLVAHRVVKQRDTGFGKPDTRQEGEDISQQGNANRLPAQAGKAQITNHQSLIGNRKSKIGNRRPLTPHPQSRTPNLEPRIPNPEFVTRGDSVGHDDPPISGREVLGRVIAIERRGRRISPRLTFWGRAAASLLSRSELCTRALLGLRRRTQFPAQ